MQRFFRVTVILLIIGITHYQGAFAQSASEGVVFVFESATKLRTILDSEQEKVLNFSIEGISTDEEAGILTARLTEINIWVQSLTISTIDQDGKRNAEMKLSSDVRTSIFTKLLITAGIRQIRIGERTLKPEELNDIND